MLSGRCSGTNCLLTSWLLIFLFVSFGVASVAPTDAAAATDEVVKSSDVNELEINLYELTDEELEDICTSRGFEIVREVDDATGESILYSHDDYVDAAKECLELEAEMEKLFKENPDILEGLQAEEDAMMKEKEELERQLAEAQERLEKEKLAEYNKGARETFFTHDGAGTSGSEREGTAPGKNATSAAARNKAKEEAEKKSEEEAPNEDEETAEAEDESGDVIDLDKGESGNADSSCPSSESEKSNLKGLEAESDSAFDGDSGKIGPLGFSRLTRETVIEFCDKMQKDLTRIGEIVLPKHLRGPLKEMVSVVLRVAKDSAISAGSLLKRYLIALIDSAKKAREDAAKGDRDTDDEKEPVPQ